MSTYAIALDRLMEGGADQPLCPQCTDGRLHPYLIDVQFLPYRGVGGVEAWVLRCVGNRDYRSWCAERDLEPPEPTDPCGFVVAATPQPVLKGLILQ